MAQPLVQIRDLSRIYHRDSTEVVALEHTNLDIDEGDFLALMGPSGSGKSTLLNIIAGIDRPSSGSVRVGDIVVNEKREDELASWRNHHVGFVFQSFNLIPVLTAFENVELPLLLTKLTSQQRRDHALTALKLVGLSDRAHHYPKQLSGGQEQRAAIARAIVSDPTVILADEPTGNLDAHSAVEILTLLSKLNSELKKTIVMVTHDARAEHYVKNVRHLDKGILLPPGVTQTPE